MTLLAFPATSSTEIVDLLTQQSALNFTGKVSKLPGVKGGMVMLYTEPTASI